MTTLRVLKFGGSSVGASERLVRVTDLILREQAIGPVAVVVSAMGDTTDWLIEAAHAAERGDQEAREDAAQVNDVHRSSVPPRAASGQRPRRVWATFRTSASTPAAVTAPPAPAPRTTRGYSS